MDQEPKDIARAGASTADAAFISITERNINGVPFIAAGNGEILSPADLGGVNYDTRERYAIEPVYEKDSHHQNSVIALKVHNPDNSQLYINLSNYKIPGEDQTRSLRNALLETYQRAASTGYGTDQLTQTAQYFENIQWVVLKDSETINDSVKHEQSFLDGELSGSFLHKSHEQQNEIFYQQHEALQQSIIRAPGEEFNMDNKKSDPIAQSLSGQILFTAADISQAQIMHANNTEASTNPATLNELLEGHKQHEQILALVLQKQNELAQTNNPTTDNQNELS